VRSSAGEVASLSNLRSLGMSLGAYTRENGGKWPYVPPGAIMQGSPPGDPEPFEFGFEPIWLLDRLWPVTMHEAAPWPEHFESWLSPGAERDRLWPLFGGQMGIGADGTVSYMYSNSFLGNPTIWDGDAAASDADIRATKVNEVVFPSRKVIMYDAERAYLRGANVAARRPLLFVDGSASLRWDRDSVTPVRNPLFWITPRPYHDTPGGVRGADF